MKQEFDSILTYRRMCNSFKDSCDGCPLNIVGRDCSPQCWPEDKVEENMQLLRKWHEENAQVTRLDKFKELFPNYPADNGGYPTICIQTSFGEKVCGPSCLDCKKKFWDEVIEE